MESHVLAWLVHYGAATLFAAQALGIVGLPIPDELLLTLAGVLVHRGQLGPVTTVGAAVSGCVSGITISYLLGRSVGVPAIERLTRGRAAAVSRARRGFQRFGCWLLTFGYFVPGVRHVTALAAGSTALPFGTFASYAYPGAVMWCAVFLGLGYVAGDRWRQALDAARGHTVLAVMIVGVTALLVWTMRARVRT